MFFLVSTHSPYTMMHTISDLAPCDALVYPACTVGDGARIIHARIFVLDRRTNRYRIDKIWTNPSDSAFGSV